MSDRWIAAMAVSHCWAFLIGALTMKRHLLLVGKQAAANDMDAPMKGGGGREVWSVGPEPDWTDDATTACDHDEDDQ